jgi:acyl-CoA thioester hydrolase
MAQPFRYRLRVRYSECDAQNARYGEYVDLAVTEFLRALGYGEALISGDLDYQLVKQTLQWKSPARFDQVVEIAVRTGHIGNTSFTLSCDFRLAGAEAVIATVETVYVLVDAHALTKKAVDGSFRSALERGIDILTDQSGAAAARC